MYYNKVLCRVATMVPRVILVRLENNVARIEITLNKTKRKGVLLFLFRPVHIPMDLTTL